jgi:uncharacterized protein (TIGR00255 family)
MIKSMTAYGRSLRLSAQGKWLIEVYSVNKKTLEFNVFISKDLLQFDLGIRKMLAKMLKRGQITVKVSFFQTKPVFEWAQQAEYLKSLKEMLEKLCEELHCSAKDITFPFLYEQLKEHAFFDTSKQEESLGQDLWIGLEEALQACLKMKEAEGSNLAIVFQEHLRVLQQLLEQVQAKLVGIEDRYRKKMLDRLQEYKELTSEDQERVLREVFLYAEKVDVSEEINRLHSHIRQFYDLLQSEDATHGRTMDFLIQEMVREVNTLSAKSDDLDVSYLLLKMKAEVEKIREQAQNVE